MLLAAVLAFLGRETLGATALGLISFSWLTSAIVRFVVTPDPTSSALAQSPDVTLHEICVMATAED
jgi:hypothetical protein